MHGKISLTLLTFSLLLCPVLGQGKECFSLTLPEALELAKEQNPDLKAARQETEVTRGRLVRARYPNPFNPEISGSAARRSFTGGPGGSNDFDIVFSQELEVAGQRGKRIEEAKRNLARVTRQVKDVERLVIAQIKDAFYRTLYLKRRLELFHEVETLNRRLQNIAASRFQAGDIPKMEVNVAEVRLGQSRKDTLVAERDYRNALRELERLLGLEPVGQLEPIGQLTVQLSEALVSEAKPSGSGHRPEPQTFQRGQLLSLALENRPDLKAAVIERERINAEIALTRRLVVPNPTIQAFYRKEERGDTITGGALSFPLPLFDRKQAELTQLAGRKAQARYEQQSVELRIRQEIGDAFRSYEAAKEEVEVFEKEVLDRAAENFQLMEIAYREGKINLLQVVVVQNDLVNAQFSYLDSLWDYWLARTALERAVGQDL